MLSHPLFKILDDYVEDCLGKDSPENLLIEYYSDVWKKLKQQVGTSSGYSGLSEYLFFRYIMAKIYDLTGESFKPEPFKRTSETFIFESPSFIMTHDIDIANYVEVERQRTDIAIFSREKRLLGAFEVKIFVSSPSVIKEMKSRFENLAEQTSSYLFGIFFDKQYIGEFEKICDNYPGRVFIISKLNTDHKLSLDEAVEKVISSR